MANLFTGEEHAKLYNISRPLMPAEIMEKTLEYCRKSSNQFRLAVDVGCGTGINTRPLLDHYTKVIGVDTSHDQIKIAQDNLPNASFWVGTAENMEFVEDSTVDLLTCFMSLHWLDHESFFQEVKRVLAPGGVFMACCYSNMELDKPDASKEARQFVYEYLAPHWNDGRKHVENQYAEIKVPLDNFHRVDNIPLERELSVSELVTYLQSLSAYQTLLKSNDNDTSLMTLEKKLHDFYTPGEKLKVSYQAFILLGSK